jgi:AhpD family alkylhydroperoxidase
MVHVPRIRAVDPEDFAPALAAALGHPTSEQRIALGSMTVWANRPDLALAMSTFMRAVEDGSVLAPRLRELVRLRIAFHNQCRSCMATRSQRAVDDGMTDGAVCSLARPAEAADLTAAEKAALGYADLVATDHLSITDADFDDLRRHFDEPTIVELGIHVGICIGFGRVAAGWDLVEALPEPFQDRSAPATPWSGGVTLR